MNNILLYSVIGFATGIIGTGLGGVITLLFRHPSPRFLSTVMNFSSGLMIAVVTFDLLPEAFGIGGLGRGLAGLLLGVGLIVMLDGFMPKALRMDISDVRSGYLKAGVLLGIGIAVHNLPEGIAIGSGFTVYERYGLALSMIIVLHDIPEGIAMATPMMMGGISRNRVLAGTVLAGIPTGIGAIVGYYLGELSPTFIAVCLGFAGGAMLYITCSELLPESSKLYRGRIPSMGTIAGIILGIVISSVI
ncbi:MAG: zinc transporter, family [Clostridiales bacterium]|nr:zinc transporter, family [Clostridiales bacterium]